MHPAAVLQEGPARANVATPSPETSAVLRVEARPRWTGLLALV
jgi:hypothetical protein